MPPPVQAYKGIPLRSWMKAPATENAYGEPTRTATTDRDVKPIRLEMAWMFICTKEGLFSTGS